MCVLLNYIKSQFHAKKNFLVRHIKNTAEAPNKIFSIALVSISLEVYLLENYLDQVHCAHF